MTQHVYSGERFNKQISSSTTSIVRHHIETVLTAIIWLFSLALIFVTGQQVILELSSVLPFKDPQMVLLEIGAVSTFKEAILFYGLGLSLISVMTISWSFFRLFRNKQGIPKNRTKPDKPSLDEIGDMVKFFKLAPEQVEEMRKSACVKVQFRTAGVTATFPVTLLKELRNDQTIYLCS